MSNGNVCFLKVRYILDKDRCNSAVRLERQSRYSSIESLLCIWELYVEYA